MPCTSLAHSKWFCFSACLLYFYKLPLYSFYFFYIFSFCTSFEIMHLCYIKSEEMWTVCIIMNPIRWTHMTKWVIYFSGHYLSKKVVNIYLGMYRVVFYRITTTLQNGRNVIIRQRPLRYFSSRWSDVITFSNSSKCIQIITRSHARYTPFQWIVPFTKCQFEDLELTFHFICTHEESEIFFGEIWVPKCFLQSYSYIV